MQDKVTLRFWAKLHEVAKNKNYAESLDHRVFNVWQVLNRLDADYDNVNLPNWNK